MGNFSVSALCDVCREVHTMHNMAIDSVDYTHYTRVYTICEDGWDLLLDLLGQQNYWNLITVTQRQGKKLVVRRIENRHHVDDSDCYRDSLTGHQSRDHWYFVGVGRDAGIADHQIKRVEESKWESSILSPSCHNNCSDEVVEKRWKVK
uniref:Uncharacterized protein n=1 Tax=Magallana gigas TaxID=29159 RepID=A0A8W8NSI9_MAGGI